MSKKTEKPKPKFQQTKLCFAAVPKKTERDLEASIQQLRISIQKKRDQPDHPDPCSHCPKATKRISCTAIKPNSDEHCTLRYCRKCIESKIDENIDTIDENTQFVNKDGDIIQHRRTDTLKWACLVCRWLCDCEFCNEHNHTAKNKTKPPKTPRLSFQVNTTKQPTFNPLDLLYPEKQIWTRLEIREFMFRFGELYEFDERYMTHLQNVQGDWKLKRLGAYIVWQVLKILDSTHQYDSPSTHHQEDTVPQRAKKILHTWMVESKIMASYLDTASRSHALLELLCLEGMTGRRWQDIAELLALAEFESIPVPTSRDDPMDIDGEELERRISRFKKSSRSGALMSSQDELEMINMLLQLLLFESDTRQSLTAQTKEIEVEFKKYQKEYAAEEMKNKMKRNHLSTRVTQLKVIRGKEEELKKAEIELDQLETHIRDERMQLEKKRLELNVQIAKSQKRMECAGHDILGNEYWIFNDILDHEHHLDHRNSEPFWAYGVVIIGPGLEKEQDSKWWYIKGKEEITCLVDWIKNQEDGDKELVNRLQQRVNYLYTLELAVYGEGFFSR